jgi:general secretion pathway protein G
MSQSNSPADAPPSAKELSSVFCYDSLKRKQSRLGFTLIEMLVVVGILLTIAAFAVPRFLGALYLAKVARAAGDLNTLEKEVLQYQLQKGILPITLADIGRSALLDPWGHPYQYLNFSISGGPGNGRTDRFGVPINSTFDVYSVGVDGTSAASLTAAVSQDDVIRGSDGSYMGLAADF